MGWFDFFSPRKSEAERLQRAAAESARRELREQPGFLRKLVLGRDPRFSRTLSDVAHGQRQQLYYGYRQSRRLNEPREELRRERYRDRLNRQLNIPGLERQLTQSQKAGHPAAQRLEERLQYAVRWRDQQLRRYDLNEKRRLRDEYFDYKRQRRDVSKQVWEQGQELREQALRQQRSAQLRQRAMYEQSNLARRQQPGRQLGQGARPSYTQPGQ